MEASAQTVPQYFLHQVQTQPPGKVAARQKEFGIWREFTWADSYEQVRDFAMGLLALGVQRDDKICTVGDNDRQYLWAYLGLQAVGAAQVGLFTDATPSEMAYVIDHSDATFVLAKDQEQCDKLLEIRAGIPNVRKVIYWDDRGLWNVDDPWLMPFEDVQALGREIVEREPGRFETEVALGQADDIAMLCYTSGTTGLPKGVMLSHGNILSTIKLYDDVDPRRDTDNHVSFLPLGWIAEPILGFAAHVYAGVIINFPEEPETVRQNIREIAPDMLFYNARLWDSLVGMVQVRMNDATWLNRALYRRFLPVGYRMADAKFSGQAAGPGLRVAYAVGDRLVFAPLRDQLGLSRIRAAYTAGSSLSPDAMRFFHALGVNLKQIYGSTEMAGGATVHRDNDIKFASVGPPAPGVELRIAADGEIQIAGPMVMRGYYKDPANTAKDIIDDDGRRWFRSGDAGYIDDDGHLIYLDRVKDMLTLAGGERFSPQFIEGRLKFSPYVRDVMAVGGENREFVTALVIIDFENVGQWAEKQRIPYTTFVDLSQRQQVYDLVRQTVEEVNESLPAAARVRRFVLMHKEFDADEAEMTRTRKLKRNVLFERYERIIDGMYAGEDLIQVRAPVRYQDGGEGFIETAIRVMQLDEEGSKTAKQLATTDLLTH
ncbi:MAG: AMP-binding protein [Candidatus Promineofilum sp.]|uniref:AMP-binding protein n=1 Tax=Promineifilum sp. TaxID=2664178 RepID=UPI002411AB2E|nr:AMP-binding protein [Promineifilum sp.]